MSNLYIKKGNDNVWESVSITTTGVSVASIKREIDELKGKMLIPTMQHTCNHCGGMLEFSSIKHIFHCPYCNAVYAIGTAHINSFV